MTDALVSLVAGNWKMNGLRADLDEIRAIAGRAGAGEGTHPEILICPPATLLLAAAEVCRGTSLRLGGQDCHAEAGGAHTGDLSAEMLADAGASYVILGHSERRSGHGETSEDVRIKAQAALRAGLVPIICVGETHAEHEAGEALPVVAAQLKGSIPSDLPLGGLVIAYEPVWAIGTGLTPTREDVGEAHACIRRDLDNHLGGRSADVRILYGGSVKPENVAEWVGLENVNGVLVGGASLKSADFLRIASAFR
jgi:triosephosphate isomerase (TIM)